MNFKKFRMKPPFFISQTLREEVAALKRDHEQLSHRLSHLQTFRHSVTRLLHLRDLPDSNVVHRLHSLCNTLEEFGGSSPPIKRYDPPTPPPVDDCLPSSRPLSSSPLRRYSVDHYSDHHLHHHHDHFDDDFKF